MDILASPSAIFKILRMLGLALALVGALALTRGLLRAGEESWRVWRASGLAFLSIGFALQLIGEIGTNG